MSATAADLEPVTLGDVGRFIGRARWWLVAGAVGGTLVGVAAGLVLPKKYRVDMVLAIVSPSESKLGGAAGSLGNIASLVGVDLSGLGAGGAGASRGEALETLKSRGVARALIERQKLMPQLYPSDTAGEHTLEQGVKRLTEKLVKVSENKASGTVNLSLTFRDRQLAAKWVGELVAIADVELRERAITDAERSIEFLEAEAKKSTVAEVRDSAFRPIQNKLDTIVITKTRSELRFPSSDAPVPPSGSSTITCTPSSSPRHAATSRSARSIRQCRRTRTTTSRRSASCSRRSGWCSASCLPRSFLPSPAAANTRAPRPRTADDERCAAHADARAADATRPRAAARRFRGAGRCLFCLVHSHV
jgi:hypothetical protein